MFGFGCGISVKILLLKVTARGVASLPRAAPSLLRAVSSILQADLLLLRADSLLTARGTASLPPEGRHVYRPRDGKFTARGAVSNKSAGKCDEN